MFTSFRKLFSKVQEQVSEKAPWRTTDIAPRITPPKCCNITLWPHQEAMLARLRYIERHPVKARCTIMYNQRYHPGGYVSVTKKNVLPEVALGIMNDPPGSGKTYALLALIALDEKPSVNVIVVPKNLIVQWRMSLANMFERDGPVTWTLVTYDAITKLYLGPGKSQLSGKKTRVLIIEDTLIDAFALACDEVVDRVVYDEIDNLKGKMTQPINAHKLWLLSASFKPDAKDCLDAFPYSLCEDGHDIHNAVCFTDPDFITQSVRLPDPVTEIINCDDRDIRLFVGLVNYKVITSLHAGNMRPLLKYIDCLDSNRSLYETAIWWADMLRETIVKDKKELALTKQCLSEIDENDPIEKERYDEKIALLVKRICDNDSKDETLTASLDAYIPVDVKKTKAYIFENEIIPRIMEDNVGRWLIFNDDIGGLIAAFTALESKGVSCEMLDGGTSSTVAETIDSFKNGELQVILINSMTEGCGLNLECATHVLFMHATNPELVGQLIGRAQRFGRKSVLTVIGLFNEMELAETVNGGI